MIKVQMSQDGGKASGAATAADVPSAVVPSASEDDVIIGKKKAMVFIEDDDPSAAAGKPVWAFADEDAATSAASAVARKAKASDGDPPTPKIGDYGGKLVLLNASRFGHAAKVLEGLLAPPDAVVLTRRGSNVYRAATGAPHGKPKLYVLQSAGSEGRRNNNNSSRPEPVIPSDNEDKMAQEIESIIGVNPGSTVLIDSATELIYTLGFEKAFSLLRRVSEAVSSYESAGVVVLVNAKAHEPRMMEAISNIANDFID